MKRSQVESKYKWKLEDIFADEKMWEECFSLTNDKIKNIGSFAGKLGDGAQMLSALKLSDEISLNLEKLYCYAKMRKDECSSLNKYVALADRAEGIIVKFNSAASYISSELSKLPEKTLDERIASSDFNDYDYMLKEIKRGKEHILSEKEERLLAMAGGSLACFSDIFNMIDNVDLPLPEIEAEGKRVKLTHGSYSLFLQNRDANIRQSAFEGMYNAFRSLINTIAANYAGNVKKDNFYSEARGYGSCLEKAMDGDNVPAKVYKNLIESVSSNLTFVHDYVRLRKKALGTETLHMYDMYVPIVADAELSLDYEKAFELVVSGLEPLGREYAGLLERAKTEGWIDVYETENKRSGAYSWGAYSTHPYVLLNYTPTTHDIFTIAHELGHALHSYYSDLSQPYTKAGYSIFVAEVASTVNEVLLLKYLLNTVGDKNVKKYLLSYYLDMFRTTLFRQTMFSEFEMRAHEMEAEGVALTEESLSQFYYELNKKYYGDGVYHDEAIRYEWARIPHFYNSFYVYKYATGLTSAVSIASKILNDKNYLPVYKKFLSAGGSTSPYEILKAAGVDLASKEPYDNAMAEFNDVLKSLEKELEKA